MKNFKILVLTILFLAILVTQSIAAYTAVIEKVSVNKINQHLYNVTIKMTVNDGQSDVFTVEASERYSSSETDLSGIKARLIEKIKADWDKYAAEHDIFSAAAFDSMVNQIQTTANAYINQ